MTDVDEFDLDEAPAGPAPSASASGRQRRHRGPAVWVVAALALVGVGAANADRQPFFFGPAGIEIGLIDADLHEPPTILWESQPGDWPYVGHVTDAAAVVVASSNAGQDYVGVDLETGAELWRYVDDSGTCQLGESVVCVDDPATPEATIIAIDTVDGTRTSVAYPQAVGAAAAGAGLVVVEATDTALEQVVLVEEDGTERWRIEADVAETDPYSVWVYLQVRDESTVLFYNGVAVDLGTGEVVEMSAWLIDDEVVVTGGLDGLVVTSGDREVTLEQNEDWIQFDDSVGGPVVLAPLSESDLEATRRADGETLWVSEATDCGVVARLRGTVVQQCWTGSSQRLRALDLATGATRWERLGAAVAGASSDTLLVYDTSPGALLGVDVDSGTELWSLRVAIPGYADLSRLPDGGLLATDATILRLYWD